MDDKKEDKKEKEKAKEKSCIFFWVGTRTQMALIKQKEGRNPILSKVCFVWMCGCGFVSVTVGEKEKKTSQEK